MQPPRVCIEFDGQKASSLTSDVDNAARAHPGRLSTGIDCGVLFIVGLISLAAHRGELGFYSDDYETLSSFALSSDQSWSGLLKIMMGTVSNIRPVLCLTFVALYKAFGLSAFSLQLFVACSYAALAPLFYFTFSCLGQRRAIIFAIALLIACLPHSSTNRVWIASVEANLSAAFYFISLWCDCAFISRNRLARIWFLIGGAMLLMSTLSYELTLPLFLINPWLIGIFRNINWRQLPFSQSLLLLFARNAVLVCSVATYKLLETRRGDTFSDGALNELARNVRRALTFNRVESDFGFNLWQFISKDLVQYAVSLPYTAVKASVRYFNWADVSFSLIVGVLVATCVLAVIREDEGLFSKARFARVVGVGIAAALCGYSVFAIERNIQFTFAGVGNRVSLMAIPGIAAALLGFLGLLCTLLSKRAQAPVFAVLIGLFCASGTLINAVIAGFFAEAAHRQLEILDRTVALLSGSPPTGKLLLTGFCPYAGPAPVFENPWDLTGALQMRFRDATLQGIVLNANYRLESDAIRVTIYGEDDLFSYEDLSGLNIKTELSSKLSDPSKVAAFLSSDDTHCPPSHFGVGVRIF